MADSPAPGLTRVVVPAEIAARYPSQAKFEVRLNGISLGRTEDGALDLTPRLMRVAARAGDGGWLRRLSARGNEADALLSQLTHGVHPTAGIPVGKITSLQLVPVGIVHEMRVTAGGDEAGVSVRPKIYVTPEESQCAVM